MKHIWKLLANIGIAAWIMILTLGVYEVYMTPKDHARIRKAVGIV